MEFLTFVVIIYIATLVASVILLFLMLSFLDKDDKEGLLTEKEYYHSLHSTLEKQYENFYKGRKN